MEPITSKIYGSIVFKLLAKLLTYLTDLTYGGCLLGFTTVATHAVRDFSACTIPGTLIFSYRKPVSSLWLLAGGWLFCRVIAVAVRSGNFDRAPNSKTCCMPARKTCATIFSSGLRLFESSSTTLHCGWPRPSDLQPGSISFRSCSML